MSVLILAVPYVFVTRIVIAQRISSFLDDLAKQVPKNGTMENNFPIAFNQCLEEWRTEKAWNTVKFSDNFSKHFENSQPAMEKFTQLIRLMHRYDFVSLILEILTRPHLLRWCFDTSRLHRRELTGAADEKDLEKLQASVEFGGHITNNGHLANLANGCSGLAEFLKEGIRLVEMIYPGRINGFPFKDVRDHLAIYEERSVVVEEIDIFKGCEIRFLTERCPLEEYLPQDLWGSSLGKHPGEPGDGGSPLRLAKILRTH